MQRNVTVHNGLLCCPRLTKIMFIHATPGFTLFDYYDIMGQVCVSND